MSIPPFDFATSDAAKLRMLIAELPEECFVERVGLEARLAEVESEIARLRTVPQPFVVLRGEDIREDDEQHVGTLLGVLPESHQFECRLAAGASFVKVDRAVSPIQDFKNAWENKTVVLQFRVVSVRSRARYVLLSASAAPA